MPITATAARYHMDEVRRLLVRALHYHAGRAAANRSTVLAHARTAGRSGCYSCLPVADYEESYPDMFRIEGLRDAFADGYRDAAADIGQDPALTEILIGSAIAAEPTPDAG